MLPAVYIRVVMLKEIDVFVKNRKGRVRRGAVVEVNELSRLIASENVKCLFCNGKLFPDRINIEHNQ